MVNIYGQIIHTVSHGRRDGESALFADAHPDKTLVPAFDNLSNTDYRRGDGVNKRIGE